MPDPRCVALIPVPTHIEPECEGALRDLERRGVTVREFRGFAAIDLARSQMATDALADGFDELVWVGPAVVFHPDDLDLPLQIAVMSGHVEVPRKETSRLLREARPSFAGRVPFLARERSSDARSRDFTSDSRGFRDISHERESDDLGHPVLQSVPECGAPRTDGLSQAVNPGR